MHSNLFAPLRCVPCSRRFSSCLPWLLPSRFSLVVSFVGDDACLSYVLEFPAKSESLTRTIPHSFLVRSLSDFAAGLDDDLLLCPVRALRIYLDRTLSLAPSRCRLFVSPSCPARAMSKNAVSSSCSRSFMGLRRHVLRWVRSVPMTFVVSLPRWCSTATGRSPRFLMQPPRAPVRCLPPFTCATFSMSFKVFARWVHSWLWVLGLCSPHLFPICSGGGGALCRPCLRCSAAPLPASSCSGLGVSRFVFLLSFSLSVFFSLFVFMRVPA